MDRKHFTELAARADEYAASQSTAQLSRVEFVEMGDGSTRTAAILYFIANNDSEFQVRIAAPAADSAPKWASRRFTRFTTDLFAW